jgi:hypothetical protein
MLAGVNEQRVSLERAQTPSSLMVTRGDGLLVQTNAAMVTFAVVQLWMLVVLAARL